MVWQQGMPAWLPYEQVAANAGATAPTAGGAPALPPQPDALAPEEWAEKVLTAESELRLGECFAKSWEMFQRNMPVTIGVFVLFTLTQLALNGLPILGPIASVFVYGPLYGGFMYYFLLLVRGEECRVGNAFLGFGPKFVPLMLAGLLITVITVLSIIPGIIVMAAGVISAGVIGRTFEQAQESIQNLNVGMVVVIIAGFLLMALLAVMVTAFLQFTYLLIMDKGLDLLTALQVSFRRSFKHGFTLLLLLILGGLLSLAGLLLCGVGMLFTVPWYFGALAVAYEKLFPGAVTKPV